MSETQTNPTKTCPFCAETIQAAAIVCRFCDRDLSSATSQQRSSPLMQLHAAAEQAEVVYLQNEDVTITSSRAVIGGKTYAMANVTSISLGVVPVDVSAQNFGGCTGLCIGVVVAGVGWLMTFTIGIIIGVLIGIGAIIIAVREAQAQKAKYVVRIGSASGESDALWGYDKNYIQQIVDAMNKAIVKRG